MKKFIDTVIYDADGVIFDSARINFNFFREMCKRFGKKQPYKTIDEWKKNLNTKWNMNYFRLGFSKEEIKEISKIFRDFVQIQKYPLNEGVEELMNSLREEEVYQGVVTSNHAELIIKNLDELLGYIGFIIDENDVSKRKPNPEGLFQALEKTNTSPNEAVYIGDMTTDIITAYNAGMSCIIHTNGLHPRKKLEQTAKKYGNCIKLVDSIQEIGDILL